MMGLYQNLRFSWCKTPVEADMRRLSGCLINQKRFIQPNKDLSIVILFPVGAVKLRGTSRAIAESW